jgi:colicin import membrane protein
VFTAEVSGNIEAGVEVRTSPDGTITGRKIIKSSGNKAWDDAVLRALDKTEILPKDTDGRVPSTLEMYFKPKDLL